MAATRPDEQVLFEATRKMDSRADREAYLQLNCEADVALAQRVLALLRAYEESPSFLESPSRLLALVYSRTRTRVNDVRLLWIDDDREHIGVIDHPLLNV